MIHDWLSLATLMHFRECKIANKVIKQIAEVTIDEHVDLIKKKNIYYRQ